MSILMQQIVVFLGPSDLVVLPNSLHKIVILLDAVSQL
jgi:hypothetical protein